MSFPTGRYQDEKKQEIASQFFKRVHEAYQVLNDPRLRAVYDLRGKKGVNDDRAIIERTILPTELLEEYEKLKSLFEERTYIQEVNPRGLFHLNIDATPLIMGSEGGREKLSVKKVYTQQSVDAQMTKDLGLSITGSAFSTHHVLFTGIQCSLRQQLENQNWIKYTALAGPFPSLGVDFYRNISSSMYITSENVIQWSPRGFGVSLNGRLARKLDNQTTAVFHVKESGNAVGVVITRQLKEKWNMSGEVQVGYQTSHIQISSKFQPREGYLVSCTVRLSTVGPSLTYGVDHTLAKLTQVGARVLISSNNGVELRLRFVRASMNYVMKIHLSPFIYLPAILYASIIPIALYGCIKAFALGPLLHQQRIKEMEEKRKEREKEMKERKQEAEAAIELMKETVQRIVSTEQARHGLIILEAWYGCLFSTQTNVDPLLPAKVIDVSIPLQCLVSDSKLVLRETSKTMVPGFYDPCIGEKKHLRVKYKFRGSIHEVTVDNSEALYIPRQSHKLSIHQEL